MPEKRRGQITDVMLREAVRQELDGVEPPPPEQMWQGIQARLAGRRPGLAASPRRRISWRRLSAAAAVLLVLLLGGLGFYRTLDRGGFHFLSSSPEAGEARLLAPDKAMDSADFGEEAAPEAASIQDEWPPPAVNGFSLAQLSETETGPGESVLVARYARGAETLFWARMEAHPLPDLALFPDRLHERLDLPVTVTGEDNGLLYLAVGDSLGLAWLEAADGSLQALWNPDGALEPEALREILERIHK